MIQPPVTNIHCRNNTSIANQQPQLLTNLAISDQPKLQQKKNPQIAAKKIQISSSHRQAPPSTTNHWLLLKPIYHHR